jgi:hypothetical protein
VTFDEAMNAVRENRAARHGTARTAARRPGWTQGVLLWDGELCIHDYRSEDPEAWGLDINAVPYAPPEEDVDAMDWEIRELWN